MGTELLRQRREEYVHSRPTRVSLCILRKAQPALPNDQVAIRRRHQHSPVAEAWKLLTVASVGDTHGALPVEPLGERWSE
jgi:hypothetical protein